MPGPLFSLLIDTLGFSAKPLFFSGLLLLQIVLAGLLGSLLAPLVWRLRTSWPVTIPILALVLWLLSYRTLIPAEGPGGQPNPLASSFLPGFGLALEWLLFVGVYVTILQRLATPSTGGAVPEPIERSAEAAPPRPIVHSRSQSISRRAVTGAIVASAVAVGASTGLRALLTATPQAPASGSAPELAAPAAAQGVAPSLGIEGLAPEITPTSEFYTVSKNFFDPVVPRASWQLEVTGLVGQPRTFDEAALHALPATTQYATLACISNEVGGDLIGNAQWKGVPLGLLLTEARVSSSAVDVVFHCHDGYADSIPIAKALDPMTLCAYEMNGEPLNDKHGAPLRMIIPDIYGMKNAKWVTKIEVVDTDFQGYWQRQGWDDAAPYRIFTRIDSPSARNRRVRVQQPVTIAGVAFAGNRGLERVEVSVDGGASWQAAQIQPPLGPLTWALWRFDWMPEQPGQYRVLARSTDGTGTLQEAEPADPYPKGAAGYHAITLQVSEA